MHDYGGDAPAGRQGVRHVPGRGGSFYNALRNASSYKEQSDKQQTAAKENRGEEAILVRANPVTYNTDKPKERDARERDQL
jgi:hypothetical protein